MLLFTALVGQPQQIFQKLAGSVPLTPATNRAAAAACKWQHSPPQPDPHPHMRQADKLLAIHIPLAHPVQRATHTHTSSIWAGPQTLLKCSPLAPAPPHTPTHDKPSHRGEATCLRPLGQTHDVQPTRGVCWNRVPASSIATALQSGPCCQIKAKR
jgi:hypothetical protein